jgi:hypothetical protein
MATTQEPALGLPLVPFDGEPAIRTHGGNGVAIGEPMILNHVAQHALGLPRSS